MRTYKIILTCLFLTFSWLTSTSAFAVSQSDPVAMLNGVANNMISGLRSNEADLQNKPNIVYNLADRYVVPYADLNMMAKSVLPPHTWNSSSVQQRAEFKKQFTTTLIRTYASALSSYKDQSVKFYPVRGGTDGLKTVEVNSEILSADHDPISVSYRMVREGSTWRLIDLSVEGVSMLESFRAQFGDILSQGNMNQLLQRMATHNNRSMD